MSAHSSNYEIEDILSDVFGRPSDCAQTDVTRAQANKHSKWPSNVAKTDVTRARTNRPNTRSSKESSGVSQITLRVEFPVEPSDAVLSPALSVQSINSVSSVKVLVIRVDWGLRVS